MVAPATGSVVLVRFPFSDLSQSKLRPAVVLADGGRGDWVLCQVTSRQYGDVQSIPLTDRDFENGSLRVESYVRPGKLFTAHHTLIVSKVGHLKAIALHRVLVAIIVLLKPPGGNSGATAIAESQNIKTAERLVRAGDLVAEVEVYAVPGDEGWSPYLSLEDTSKLHDVQAALRVGNLGLAFQLARRIYRLTPIGD